MEARKSLIGWLAAAASIICACALCCSLAWAAEPANSLDDADSSGNIVSNGGSASYGAETKMPHSLYWAGQSLSVDGSDIAGDIIAAGMDVDVEGCSVSGNVRTASRNSSVNGAKVACDITSAGQNVGVGAGTSCNAAYLTGASVTFDGTANALNAVAYTATISGTVNGDAYVSANNVVIEDGAVITGKLTVNAPSDPVVAAGATIGDLDFQKVESDSAGTPMMGGMFFAFGLCGMVLPVIASVLTALVLAWFSRRALRGSGEMIRTRPVQTLVTGFIAGIVSIPVLILLFVFIFPVGCAVLCALIAILFIAVPFAGASLACMLLPNWNRSGAAALGALVAGVSCVLPFVGALVTAAACIYLTGYVLQVIYLDMKAPVAPGTTAAQTAPNASILASGPAIQASDQRGTE